MLKKNYCMDCGKELKCKDSKRCRSCANKELWKKPEYREKYEGKNNSRYKDGRTIRKYYCVDCGKELSYYTHKRCGSCSSKERVNRKEHIEKMKDNQYAKGYKWTKEQKENLNRGGKDAPNYTDGRWVEKYYCAKCGEEIKTGNQGSKICKSCSAKKSAKEKWQNPNFRKLKSEQGKQQWRDGRMDGVFDNRKIHIESPNNPEKEIMKMLEKLSINYVFQFRPEGYSRIYDFYIQNMDLLIEFDGIYWHSFPENIIRDIEKTEYAKNNGYELLRFNENNLNDFESSILEKIKKEENYART